MDYPRISGTGEGQAADPPVASAAGVPAPESGARSDVDQLGPGATGRWLVTTRGSLHTFDLDAGTYLRRPRPGHGRFIYDGQAAVLGRVERWPQVGATFFIWVDDPRISELVEHWHQSSTVISIIRLPDDPAAPGRADA
jgi:hypothetical protein